MKPDRRTAVEPQPITWLAKLPHEMTAAERHMQMFHEPLPDDAGGLRVIGYLAATILGLIIGALIIWTLASIHKTTERVCPTMDAACQVAQESPE